MIALWLVLSVCAAASMYVRWKRNGIRQDFYACCVWAFSAGICLGALST